MSRFVFACEMQATLSDILRQLGMTSITRPLLYKLSFWFTNCFVSGWQSGNHFSVDLLHRKSEVKDIITEVIKNMSDDEEDEDDEASESGDESGKDGGDDEA